MDFFLRAEQLKSSQLVVSIICVAGANACTAPKDVANQRQSDSVLAMSQDTARGVKEATEVQGDTSTKSGKVVCSPEKVRIGDSVMLQMSTPHGGYLAGISPEGTFYFVVDPLMNRRPLHFSLVSSEEFRNMAMLRLPTSVRAPAHVYGRDSTLEPVFDKPGAYEVRVGENLESDYGPPPSSCKIS